MHTRTDTWLGTDDRVSGHAHCSGPSGIFWTSLEIGRVAQQITCTSPQQAILLAVAFEDAAQQLRASVAVYEQNTNPPTP